LRKTRSSGFHADNTVLIMLDEKCLWAAVLIQAIKDLRGLAASTVSASGFGSNFARMWFSSSNHEMGSYLWICDELGLEPSWISRRMSTSISADEQRTNDEAHFIASNSAPLGAPMRARRSSTVGHEFTKFLEGYTPGSNLFYFRLMVKRWIWHNVMKIP
jgi:hypothetical protein